ncbi:hypothetical protein Ahy_B09g097387 [Arachis hypogaea]|uniref:Transposase MuDR plant domain-containing protein n=1 Tax=Arachis hypogaea TaxID=3818 RepID=A0A444XPL7_ARAHY|nr:hypothetical protein Ahy_B09g097387 [Arachis hypogaea]
MHHISPYPIFCHRRSDAVSDLANIATLDTLSEEVLYCNKELLFRHRGNALMVVDHSLLLCILFFPKNEGLVDVYFEHAFSTPEILEGNEIVEYVEGDHDDLREVSDEADNEPLQDETPNQANKPTTPADETPFTKNTEPMHNTSPPKTTEPTDPGANNPTTQNSNPTTTPNSNPSQATTAKPVTTTPPVLPKMKPNSNTKRREPGSKHAPAEGLAKSKKKFLNDDDALVVDDEECDVDLSFLEVPVTGDENLDNSYDPGAESDGENSWHSEEMKTPPPSEDEFSEEEPDDVFPVFRDGIRFGDLKLEVGMKFNTKWEFREAVREFTIKEGRRIQFIKNDAVRCRAVCKAEECKWVVYASRDHEETCWQIKTFNDYHTCAREATNRAANRNWLTSKLVKKVRKYPNFRQCEAAVYFKSKCDLMLNRNSISRTLADTRAVVYGDEKAQYAMVWDYGETLLKCN